MLTKQQPKKSEARQLHMVNNQIDSTTLFQSTNTITIVHQEEQYKLTLTKTGKLILTK